MVSALILLLTLFASFFGTVTGFGTSTIVVPVLAIWFPLPEVLLFVGIIHWFGDIWKMYFFKRGINWKLILLFGIPGIIASYIGASIPLLVDSSTLERLLAVFLFLYTIYIFFKPEWKIPEKDGSAVTGGLLSGFMAGIFGVGGAVRGAFLSSFSLPKSVYIFTSGAIAFLIDSTRLTRYYTGGITFEDFSLTLLAIAIPTSFLGAYLAKKTVNKIPQDKFRYVIGLGLLFASVMLFIGL